MMRNETRQNINGRSWRVKLVTSRELPRTVLGDCDTPPGPHPLIRVRRALGARLLLDTIVHEVLHASLPQLSEEAVAQAATDIARVLFALNYRRTSPCQPRPKANDS